MGNHVLAKPSMYCTNYHYTNHKVETCKSKKEEPAIAITKPSVQVGKPFRPLNYPCHICEIMGHKLTNF
jgi:hypothetical protein